MNLDLQGLEELSPQFKPGTLQTIYFIFFERGVTLAEFNELPIPYILDIFKSVMYFEEQKSKALKKK